MKITIHQPEYMPWLGLIDKISRVDLFVILDTTQFEKNNFQNRNKIRTDKGSEWITVPVKKLAFETIIKDMKISYNEKWVSKHLNKIKQHYYKSKYFDNYFPVIKEILEKKHSNLSQLNIELTKQILKWFDINTKVIIASDLDMDYIKGGTKVNLEICKKIKTNYYLSGPSGKNYLDLSHFKNSNIEVSFQEFNHPVYKQQYEPFIDKMSAIDLLFNHGPNSKEILNIN